MSVYSDGIELFLTQGRAKIERTIRSYEKSDSNREKYPTLADWFIWEPKRQEMYGYRSPIQHFVEMSWSDLKPNIRKEIGSKQEASELIAGILKDEYQVDIVEEVRKHSIPCYGVDEQVDNVDWDDEAVSGYKKVAKLIKHKDLDQGSALKLYWMFSPEFYTQYVSEKEISEKGAKKAFKLVKGLEQRLLEGDFKSNIIPYRPYPEGSVEDDAKWQIPEKLLEPNIDF